jgi:hypothetical protein
MFDVEVCEPKRIVLIRFRGELAQADFAALDAMGRAMQGGPAYDVVFDMTNVEKSHVATDFVSQRGELPQAFADRERIYVVQQDDLKLLVKLYAAYQASKGWRSPVVVATLDEALARLGVTVAEFGPPSAPAYSRS